MRSAVTLSVARRTPGAPGLLERSGRFGDVALFVVAALSTLHFGAGGQVFISELALLAALPFLLDTARRRGVRRVNIPVVVMGCIWLAGQVLTDIYRGTPMSDLSRGWANIAIFLTDFACLALAIDGRWRRIWLFAGGYAVGGVLSLVLQPNPYASGSAWKFGYGPSVTLGLILAAALLWQRSQRVVAILVVLAAAALNLEMGSRSASGVCALAGVVAIAAVRSERRMRIFGRRVAPAVVVALILLASIASLGLYGELAASGELGSSAQKKYQAEEGSAGILVGGRPELLVSLGAIRDSPLLGHGSWANEPKYALELNAMLERAGYANGYQIAPSDGIPTHSHVTGAWVSAGILGGLFWIWVLLRLCAGIGRLHLLRDGRVVFCGYWLIGFVWSIFFSPFGGIDRLKTAFVLVLFQLSSDGLPMRSDVTPVVASQGR